MLLSRICSQCARNSYHSSHALPIIHANVRTIHNKKRTRLGFTLPSFYRSRVFTLTARPPANIVSAYRLPHRTWSVLIPKTYAFSRANLESFLARTVISVLGTNCVTARMASEGGNAPPPQNLIAASGADSLRITSQKGESRLCCTSQSRAGLNFGAWLRIGRAPIR